MIDVRRMSWRQLAAAAAVVGAMLLMFYLARAVDEAGHVRTIDRLNRLRALNARLTMLVVEARSGEMQNYDGIVATLQGMNHQLRGLRDGPMPILHRGSADVDEALERFSADAREREDLVERFKSQNALLRNSMRYLPRAADQVLADPSVPPALRDAADAMERDMLMLRIGTNPSNYERAAQALQDLRARASTEPPQVRARLTDMTRHAASALAHARDVGELVGEICAPRQQRLMDALSATYNAWVARAMIRAGLFRALLLAVSLLVLAWAISLFTRLRENGEKLARTLEAQAFEIRERKLAEERLAQLAQFDALTGLPNRSLFRDRLEQALARAQRNGQMVALMFIDLDRFKEINDTLGHAVGDRVLQAAANLLRSCLREVDTVARLGGDEFTVILENITEVRHAGMIAEKINRAFSEPLLREEVDVVTSASIGVTLYPRDATDADGLLQAADVAMYHAKQEGRNRHEFYAPAFNARAAEQLQMGSLLWRALDNGELAVHYQPKVEVKTGRITGVEALLRWNSPELGSVPPVRFIPMAEHTGLIVPIGEWVLRTACAQNKAWQDEGVEELVVSVNLSARQLREKDFVASVATVLAETGLAPHCLELELTESMIMERPEQMAAVLEELRRLGVKISVDDFGTGYSSLAYLKRFPVTTLKIDRSFLRDLPSDSEGASIVKAIDSLAKSLGLGVVAEGVEKREQLQFLQSIGCAEYQGYYFSKPVPPAQIGRLLRRDRSAAFLLEAQVA